MNLEQWQKAEYTGMKPGLGRIREFLRCAGNPQNAFRSVHIAGTNGKGSTAVMTAAMLTAAGYRTGLYTSPHLVSVAERIRIDGNPVPGPELERIVRCYGAAAREAALSFFEFMTAAAFIYFERQKVDIAVLETGLGGRFDATNVILRPLVSIITDIDYDHCDWLGDTLGEIAREKGGIIKKGCPVIIGAERETAIQSLRLAARRSLSKVFQISKDFEARSISHDWVRLRQRICYNGSRGRFCCELPLLGKHQAKNAALALAARDVLSDAGVDIPQDAVRRGFNGASWPGRFDVRCISVNGRRKTVVLDGAHNPGGVKRFVETWETTPWASGNHSFVFGVLADKAYGSMVRMLAGAARRIYLVPVESKRAMSPSELAAEWRKYISGDRVIVVRSVEEALSMSGRDAVAVTGSLYLIGGFLKNVNARS